MREVIRHSVTLSARKETSELPDGAAVNHGRRWQREAVRIVFIFGHSCEPEVTFTQGPSRLGNVRANKYTRHATSLSHLLIWSFFGSLVHNDTQECESWLMSCGLLDKGNQQSYRRKKSYQDHLAHAEYSKEQYACLATLCSLACRELINSALEEKWSLVKPFPPGSTTTHEIEFNQGRRVNTGIVPEQEVNVTWQKKVDDFWRSKPLFG